MSRPCKHDDSVLTKIQTNQTPVFPLHSPASPSSVLVSWGVKNVEKLNELSRETLLYKWLLSNDDLSTVTDKPDYGCLQIYNFSKISLASL